MLFVLQLLLCFLSAALSGFRPGTRIALVSAQLEHVRWVLREEFGIVNVVGWNLAIYTVIVNVTLHIISWS